MENLTDENQFRVCTCKEDLISPIKVINKQTDKLMNTSLYPTVSIAPKDFMPIALELKAPCKNTDVEFKVYDEGGITVNISLVNMFKYF